jgi:hypothetical protein
MSLEQLKKRQQKEIDYYWQCRAKRLELLERDQKEITSHCIIMNAKTNDLVKQLLAEQRQVWEEMEEDDIDMLQHVHQLEMENLLDKEAKQDQLKTMLASYSSKEKDRGR